MITKTIKTSGAELYLQEYGSGSQPVILLHGGPGIVGYMQSLGDLIASSVLVVDYYQRGAFRSPSSGPFLIQNHVNDLREIVARYSSNQLPILLGHSWGAVLALCYLAAYPGTCKKAVLVGTGPLDPSCSSKFRANIDARLGAEDLKRKKELLENIDDESLSWSERSKWNAEFLQLITPVYNRNPKSFSGVKLELPNLEPLHLTGDDYSNARNEGRLLEMLQAIIDPVVAFHGSYDPIPVEGVIPVLKSLVPHAELQVLEGYGHMPWLELQPEQFVVRLESLLR